MIKEFIPYEQALKLKELGFDEECLAYYNNHLPKNEHKRGLVITTIIQDHNIETEGDDLICSAALWQQAFDWFTSLGYHSYIEGAYPWFRYYINSEDNRWEGYKHLKIEEARIECLKKLIEIVKMNNNHG